jgi:hypothetical protein
MKFLFNNETVPVAVPQFSVIQVVCSVDVMADLLSISTTDMGYSPEYWKETIKMRSTTNVDHLKLFRSGAKLLVRDCKEFFIYCYHYSGKDGLAAVQELKMLYAIREAKRKADAMFKLMDYREYDLPGLTWSHNFTRTQICKRV